MRAFIFLAISVFTFSTITFAQVPKAQVFRMQDIGGHGGFNDARIIVIDTGVVGDQKLFAICDYYYDEEGKRQWRLVGTGLYGESGGGYILSTSLFGGSAALLPQTNGNATLNGDDGTQFSLLPTATESWSAIGCPWPLNALIKSLKRK